VGCFISGVTKEKRRDQRTLVQLKKKNFPPKGRRRGDSRGRLWYSIKKGLKACFFSHHEKEIPPPGGEKRKKVRTFCQKDTKKNVRWANPIGRNIGR